jgi:hypothetical protein
LKEKNTYIRGKIEPLTQTCTVRIVRFIDGIFCRYLYLYSVGNKFIDILMDRNSLSLKLSSVIFILSVMKLLIDLMMAKTHQKKLPFSFRQYFSREFFHITVRNTICNSFSD